MKFILLLLKQFKRGSGTYGVPGIEKKKFIYKTNYKINFEFLNILSRSGVDAYLPLISYPGLKKNTGKTFARYCRRFDRTGGIPQKISPLEA